MDLTADELSSLRSRNISDDNILDKVKDSNPGMADELSALQKRGIKADSILDNYVKYRADTPSQPSSDSGSITKSALGTAGRFGQALAYGMADEANRLADTAQYVGGSDPTATRGAARVISNMADLNQYDPASSHLGLSADGLSYLPRAAVEAVPTTGSLLAAGGAGALTGSVIPGVGTVAGGLAGMGAYGLARYWGRTVKERAENNNHAQPTNGDVWSALPSAAAQSAFDTVGGRYLGGSALLEKALATGAGKEALAQTIGNFAKSGAVNAATAGASDVAGQIGSTAGTTQGLNVSPAEIGNAAVTGGLVSSALKLPQTVKHGIMDIRQGNTDSTVRGDLSRLMSSTRVTGDPNDGGQTDQVITNTRGIIGNDTKDAVAAVKARIKANQEVNQPTADLEAALKTSTDALSNMKGGKLDQGQADAIRSMEGGQEVQALKKQLLMRNELENVAQKANQDPTGDTDSGPFHTGMSTRTALYHSGLSYLYGHPGLATLYAAPALAARGIKSVVSKALGSGNFVPEYVRRFSGETSPIVGSPAFNGVDTTAPSNATGGLPPAPSAPQAPTPPVPPRALTDYSNVIRMGQSPRETGADLPYSLLSLRAAASGLDPNSTPQQAVTAEGPIATARARSKAFKAPQKPSEAQGTPQASNGAAVSLKAPVTTPESSISLEPSVKIPNDFVEADIGNGHGTRTWHQQTIRKGDNGAAKAAGTRTSADTRRGITEAAANLKLSPEGKKALPGIISHLKSVNEASWNDNATSAREQVAKAAEGLPEADRAKFKKHFETHTHNGKQFYHSWKHGSKAEKIAGDKKKVAKYRERTTKRAKAAQKEMQ